MLHSKHHCGRSLSTSTHRFLELSASLTCPQEEIEKKYIISSSPRKRRSTSGGSPYLLSNVPFSQSTPSNIFGIGSQHPFANYWTCQVSR